MTQINYGEYFRLLLKKYKLTQTDLSKITGISQKQISRYINNGGSLKPDKLNKILMGIQELANDLINPNREYIDNGLTLLDLRLPNSALECENLIQELTEDIKNKNVEIEFDYDYEEQIKSEHKYYQTKQIESPWEEVPSDRLVFWKDMKAQLIDLEYNDISFLYQFKKANDKRRKQIKRILDKESLKFGDYDYNIKIQKKLSDLSQICEWMGAIRLPKEFTLLDYMDSLRDFVSFCCERNKDTLQIKWKFEELSDFNLEEWFYLMKYQIWLMNHPDEDPLTLIRIAMRQQ